MDTIPFVWTKLKVVAICFRKGTDAFCGFWSLSNLNNVLQRRNMESNWLDVWKLDKVLRIEAFCVSPPQLCTWTWNTSLVSLYPACWLCLYSLHTRSRILLDSLSLPLPRITASAAVRGHVSCASIWGQATFAKLLFSAWHRGLRQREQGNTHVGLQPNSLINLHY